MLKISEIEFFYSSSLYKSIDWNAFKDCFMAVAFANILSVDNSFASHTYGTIEEYLSIFNSIKEGRDDASVDEVRVYRVLCDASILYLAVYKQDKSTFSPKLHFTMPNTIRVVRGKYKESITKEGSHITAPESFCDKDTCLSMLRILYDVENATDWLREIKKAYKKNRIFTKFIIYKYMHSNVDNGLVIEDDTIFYQNVGRYIRHICLEDIAELRKELAKL